MPARSIERAVGQSGADIVGQAEVQLIRLEEHGCGGQRFIQQARELVKGSLVRYLETPKGRTMQGEICIIMPLQRRRLRRIMEMIGSGRPLSSQVDIDNIIDQINVPSSPYIIYNVGVPSCLDNRDIPKRDVIFMELLFRCATMKKIKPGTVFAAMNSRVGEQGIAIAFDSNCNPRVISTPATATNGRVNGKANGRVLCCAQEIIV